MNKPILLVVLSTILLTFSASAKVILRGSVDAAKGIPAWKESLWTATKAQIKEEEDFSGYTECAETTNVSGAYLCASFRRNEMNEIFTRASIYSEGGFGHAPGDLAVASESALKKAKLRIGGHDIKGAVLLKFFEEMESRCNEGAEQYCLNNNESQFYENILKPVIAKRSDCVFITFAFESLMSYQVVIGHEFLHSYYFLNPTFVKVVDNFWNKNISEADRSKIREALGEKGYDAKDEYVMRNEFQAYLLQPPAFNNPLNSLRPKYRNALWTALARAKIHPVQIK